MKMKNPSGVFPYALTISGKVYTIPPGESIEVDDKPKKSSKSKGGE